MLTKVQIFFEASKIPGKAEAILFPAGCGPDVAYLMGGVFLANPDGSDWHEAQFVKVTLDEGDERIGKVLALLEKYGKEPEVTTYSVYLEEELQNATLLRMQSDGSYARSYAAALGTKYDLKHACSHCGTGAKQSWYLRVKRKNLKEIHQHPAIMTFDAQILVGVTMRKRLVDAGITGISFAEVQSRDDVGFWKNIDREQILIEHVMPPMRGEPTADDEQRLCKVCRRGGRVSFPDKPYAKEDLVGMKDFNLTWEWFGSYSFDGNVRTADFSQPRILVTPKVMNIFRNAEVKSFKWSPVDVSPSLAV
jgi:hypothetical protein